MADSLIGKTYHVVDNSYAICLNDDSKTYILGIYRKPGITTICCDPFEAQVANSVDKTLPEPRKTHKREVILVQCHQGFLHRVIFLPEQVQ